MDLDPAIAALAVPTAVEKCDRLYAVYAAAYTKHMEAMQAYHNLRTPANGALLDISLAVMLEADEAYKKASVVAYELQRAAYPEMFE